MCEGALVTILILCLSYVSWFYSSYYCSAVAEGIPADNGQLVLLFFMSQLFHRELAKSKRLVQIVPMDMTSYYGKRN